MIYTLRMIRRTFVTLAALLLLSSALGAQAPAPPKVDITGKWTAVFETQIGTQNYTYEFVVKNGVLTGKMTSGNGTSAFKPGKVEGDTVTFGETLTFMEMEIPVSYTGQIVSVDEIKFTRQVGEFATEELVAKRAK
jgi:hypothetical protein